MSAAGPGRACCRGCFGDAAHVTPRCQTTPPPAQGGVQRRGREDGPPPWPLSIPRGRSSSRTPLQLQETACAAVKPQGTGTAIDKRDAKPSAVCPCEGQARISPVLYDSATCRYVTLVCKVVSQPLNPPAQAALLSDPGTCTQWVFTERSESALKLRVRPDPTEIQDAKVSLPFPIPMYMFPLFTATYLRCITIGILKLNSFVD